MGPYGHRPLDPVPGKVRQVNQHCGIMTYMIIWQVVKAFCTVGACKKKGGLKFGIDDVLCCNKNVELPYKIAQSLVCKGWS